MGAFLERRNRRAPGLAEDARPHTTRTPRDGQWSQTQFVPARWLVLALSVVWAVFSPGPISKVGIASLAWSVAPRSLRIAAAGFALVATVVFFGAVAAIALLALHLT